jgi:hypothetical protein
MDPHKRSATIEVMTADETIVGRGRFATDREGTLLSRAWFERAENTSHGAWRMTVEHQMRYPTNHHADFRDLLTIAKEAGVTEFYVWSAEDADFRLSSVEAVIEPPPPPPS